MSGVRRVALALLFVSALAGSGLVTGFCVGGFTGSHGGHDLGLGALFTGAAAGFTLAARHIASFIVSSSTARGPGILLRGPAGEIPPVANDCGSVVPHAARVNASG